MRWFGKETNLRGPRGIGACPSWTRFVTAGAGERGVLVGIWYAESRASPVAPKDLKAAIRLSGGIRGMRGT